LLKGGIDQYSVDAIALLFGLSCIKATNPWVVQDWGSKFACVGLAMKMLIKIQMPSLVNTMLTR
jgi:hypothetical protein